MTQRATQAKYHPQKRELRAVWMPTIYRGEYATLSTEGAKQLLRQRLNLLQSVGFNAVIFQVRAEADAWYDSPYEPWSRFLTGRAGEAPSPYWDPLAFMIEECHSRQMELHAWINPYRASSNVANPLPPKHPYYECPEWFVTYHNQLLFNPTLPEVRSYIAQVVGDLVSRYDLDAIHLDDYFYPYPVAGLPFPDREAYLQQTGGRIPIGEWRRSNVSQLIQLVHQTIKSLKPYVQLGISPFGIYRNQKSDPKGSVTYGLQNYDDLYADILQWDRAGWVDYIMPQIYWPTGHTAAEYTELARWWGRNLKHAKYYIGQDVKRTMDASELHTKMNITHQVAEGQCFWPGDEIFQNYRGIADQISRIYWEKPALPPSRLDGGDDVLDAPEAYTPEAYEVSIKVDGEGHQSIHWRRTSEGEPTEGQQTRYYIIYCHPRKTKEATRSELKYLMAVTSASHYTLPQLDGKHKVDFTITRLNRFNQELPVATNIPLTL